MYNNNYNNYGYGGYGYNSNYYNPSPSAPTQAQQQASFIPLTFVNGIEGAKAYIVSPNSTIYLRDSDSDKIFIKSSDAQGRLMLRTYRLVEVNENEPKQPAQDLSSFATKDDLKEIKERIDKIQIKLEEKEKAVKDHE